MIFIYLSFITALGLGVLLVQEQKNTKLSFLQILKRSCSIDSVQFESYLKQSKNDLLQVKKQAKISKTNIVQKLSKYYFSHLNFLKKCIRKRLHPETDKIAESAFIVEIQKDSRS